MSDTSNTPESTPAALTESAPDATEAAQPVEQAPDESQAAAPVENQGQDTGAEVPGTPTVQADTVENVNVEAPAGDVAEASDAPAEQPEGAKSQADDSDEDGPAS